MSEELASAKDGRRQHVLRLYREPLGRCQASCTVRGTDEVEADCVWSGSGWTGERAARSAASTHVSAVRAWAVAHRGTPYPTAGRRSGWAVCADGGWAPLERDREPTTATSMVPPLDPPSGAADLSVEHAP